MSAREAREEEEDAREEDGVVETTVLQLKQPPPVEMEKFWGSSINKMPLEQIFIEWIIKSYKGSRPLLLSGGNKDDITSCAMIANGKSVFSLF